MEDNVARWARVLHAALSEQLPVLLRSALFLPSSSSFMLPSLRVSVDALGGTLSGAVFCDQCALGASRDTTGRFFLPRELVEDVLALGDIESDLASVIGDNFAQRFRSLINHVRMNHLSNATPDDAPGVRRGQDAERHPGDGGKRRRRRQEDEDGPRTQMTTLAQLLQTEEGRNLFLRRVIPHFVLAGTGAYEGALAAALTERDTIVSSAWRARFLNHARSFLVLLMGAPASQLREWIVVKEEADAYTLMVRPGSAREWATVGGSLRTALDAAVSHLTFCLSTVLPRLVFGGSRDAGDVLVDFAQHPVVVALNRGQYDDVNVRGGALDSDDEEGGAG